MPQTLLTGVTGLLAHQRKLDIVANNLANLNTTAYKTQRILFSDLLYTTHQNASPSSSTRLGGINPIQTGFGVQVSQTSRNHGQGVLEATGSVFDYAIQGEGYFVISDGSTKYTRAGSFSLDSRGFLVDPSTGALVQRHGTLGEGTTAEPGFQTQGNHAIRIPLGAAIPGRATTSASFIGNLPSSATPPKAEIQSSTRPYLEGGSPATLTTTLNNLDSNISSYGAGDQINLTGKNFDGSPITATLSVDATTTVGDIVDLFNSVLVGATAQLLPDGKIQVSALSPGATTMQLELSDDASNTGSMQFSNHLLLTAVLGKDADIVETTMQVFDSRGEVRTLSAEFSKIDLNSWDANFKIIDGSGTETDGFVERLEFAEDGSFRILRGTGLGDENIELRFDSLSQDQTIDISLSGLTHLATNFSTTYEQDGFPPGSLVSVNATSEGILEGIATNGQRIPIAQLAIASFVNSQGLEAVGQNYYQQTANSGQPQVGGGLSGANGIVRGGQLETSNVDVALEFTQLIVAQRGFSANARTITVASEVLQELTNILN